MGQDLGACSPSGTVSYHEQRAIFFLMGKSGVGLEAAAAAGFVHAGGTDDDQLFAFDKTLRMHRGIAAAHANGQQLDDLFRDGQQARHRLEGTPAVIRVETRDDDTLAEVGKLRAHIDDFVPKELRFIDAYYFRAWLHLLHDLGSLHNIVGGNTQAGVRDDFVGGVAFVNGGLENLHALAGDFGAAKATDQFFALAGKHRADDYFDPAHIALDDVHAVFSSREPPRAVRGALQIRL